MPMVRARCLSLAAVVFLILGAVGARAEQWQTLGSYSASGANWVPCSGYTANNVYVSFDLSCDLPACGQSTAYFLPTAVIVDYQESVLPNGKTDTLLVRLSYLNGPSSAHWKN